MAIAYEVGVQAFEQGFARQDFGRHRRGMGHAGAADRLNERLLHNALLTLRVSLQVPCCGAHQPMPWDKPEISLICLDSTHRPSSGMGAGP